MHSDSGNNLTPLPTGGEDNFGQREYSNPLPTGEGIYAMKCSWCSKDYIGETVNLRNSHTTQTTHTTSELGHSSSEPPFYRMCQSFGYQIPDYPNL